MCILCVASRWSRRIVTMLPWLVIPLIILWALSQLLPPGFRFEVTSPRLACVFVLLISLGWYEILMPRLSSWRARRSALMRERRRIEALEAARWRKEATRRCRNCLTAYRDQNPGGGRFMCTYCGHVSRRPVLDIPGATSGIVGNGNPEGIASSGVPLQAGVSQNGITGSSLDLGKKNVRAWNGKGWPDRASWTGGNPWIGSQFWASDWSTTGSWLGGSWPGTRNYWGDNAGTFRGVFGGGEQCSAEKSYSGVVIFLLRIFGFFLFCIRWAWKKVFRGASSGDDGASTVGRKPGSKKGEDGFNSQGNKGEKARRKAEEKRQARLEKEMLEEEERKQREEVARLVEERRRLRDEKLEAEKESEREAAAERERENRREREAERRRQEKIKEREKGLGKDKSHTDGEDVKKKNYKENERKFELDRKGETERREVQKNVTHQVTEPVKSAENFRAHGLEMGFKNNDHGIKGGTSSLAKVSGSRYLDHVKGSFLSASKTSASQTNNATSFWGKSFRTASGFGMNSGKPAISGDILTMPIPDSSIGPVGLQSTQSGSSAWNRMAWTKVWGKGSGIASEDVSRQQPSAISNMGGIQCGGFEAGKPTMNGMDKNPGTMHSQSPGGVERHPVTPATTQTKSWQHLFSSPTSSSSVPCPADLRSQLDQQQTGSMSASMLALPASSSLRHICFGSSMPVPLGSAGTTSVFSNSVVVSVSAAESMNSSGAFSPPDSVPLADLVTDETDSFEDPSYVPDPVSLLGPVSESLDNFSLDLATGLPPETGITGVLSPRRIPMSASINRPAPIESPVSKLLPSEIVNEVHFAGDELPPITEPWGLPSLSLDCPKHVSEQGKWQMWDTPQIGQSEIGGLGEPCNWLLSCGNGILDQEKEFMQPLSQRNGRSPFKMESHLPHIFSPQMTNNIPNPNGTDFTVAPVSSSNSLWSNQPAFDSAAANWDEPDCHQGPTSFVKSISQGQEGAVYDSVILADGPSYEQTSASIWCKPSLQEGEDRNNWSVETTSGVTAWSTTTKTLTRPHIGGIYTTNDVQSVWSYK